MIPFNLARKLILPFAFMWKRLDSFEGQLMGFRYFHVGSSSFLLVETLSNFILKNILNLPPKTTKTSCMLGNSTVHLINRTCTVKGIPTAIFSICYFQMWPLYLFRIFFDIRLPYATESHFSFKYQLCLANKCVRFPVFHPGYS